MNSQKFSNTLTQDQENKLVNELMSEITKKYSELPTANKNINTGIPVNRHINTLTEKSKTRSQYDNIVFEAKLVNDNNGGYNIIVTINKPVTAYTKYGMINFAIEQNVDITIAGSNFFVASPNTNNRYIMGNTIIDKLNSYYYLPVGIIPSGTRVEINRLSVILEENLRFDFPDNIKLLFEEGTIIQGTNNDMVAQLTKKSLFFVKLVSQIPNNLVKKELFSAPKKNIINTSETINNSEICKNTDTYDDLPYLDDDLPYLDDAFYNGPNDIYDGTNDITDVDSEQAD